MMRWVLLASWLMALSSMARAECNISDLMFGKVRIEMILHSDPDNRYETGIIFGDDFDSKRFSYDRILGRIDAPERDGSRKVSNTNLDSCGRIESDLTFSREDADCSSCSKSAVVLQRVGKTGFAVLSDGMIMGTIQGHLPRAGRF